MYFITTIQEKNGKIKDSRCVGYLKSEYEAVRIVTNNSYDIFENLYNYVVIEKLEEGIYQYDQNPQWFELYTDVEGNPKYRKIEKPEWTCGFCGFGIG